MTYLYVNFKTESYEKKYNQNLMLRRHIKVCKYVWTVHNDSIGNFRKESTSNARYK